MIRPRNNSPYHEYDLVFQDLRDGTLSQADYELMMAEDLTEASRRKAWVAYLRAEAIMEHEDGRVPGAMKRASLRKSVRLGGMSGIKVKDEPSGAY